MMDCGIYAITHIATGNQYVGHSCAIKRRWRAHKKLLNAGTHHAKWLQNAWSKYGPDAFQFDVLEGCDRAELVKREQHYFDLLRPAFNTAPIAGSRLGVPQSDEVKARIAAKLKGRTRSRETAAKTAPRALG